MCSLSEFGLSDAEELKPPEILYARAQMNMASAKCAFSRNCISIRLVFVLRTDEAFFLLALNGVSWWNYDYFLMGLMKYSGMHENEFVNLHYYS